MRQKKPITHLHINKRASYGKVNISTLIASLLIMEAMLLSIELTAVVTKGKVYWMRHCITHDRLVSPSRLLSLLLQGF